MITKGFPEGFVALCRYVLLVWHYRAINGFSNDSINRMERRTAPCGRGRTLIDFARESAARSSEDWATTLTDLVKPVPSEPIQNKVSGACKSMYRLKPAPHSDSPSC